MRPLISKPGIPCIADCQPMQPARKRRAQILVELCDVDLFISVGNIYFLLIKQKRGVVIKAFDILFFPWSRDGF